LLQIIHTGQPLRDNGEDDALDSAGRRERDALAKVSILAAGGNVNIGALLQQNEHLISKDSPAMSMKKEI